MDISSTRTKVLEPLTADSTQTVRVTLDVPVDLAVRLKHRNLDLAEAALLVCHLYADAPLESIPGMILNRDDISALTDVLARTPQSPKELIGLVAEMGRVSLAGVKVQLSAADLDIINGRNAEGLSAKEWGARVLRESVRGWIDGKI